MRGPVWIFDLDNTLHDADPHIFPHINRAMTAYVAQVAGLAEAAASEPRTRYWKRYGATLLGLMRHHGTDPHHFLRATHAFDDLPSMVVRDARLRPALARLPGRKLVFSNAPVHYSIAVLEVLRIADLFDDVFTIERTGFCPKPSAQGFRRFLESARADPVRCIMVEDSLPNLRTAKRFGMRTVWVGRAVRSPAYVDVTVRSVAGLPRRLAHLGERTATGRIGVH